LVLAPSILLSDLLLFLGSKIVLDVEVLANFVRGLTLDHVGYSLAAIVHKTLDIQVVCGQENGEKHRLFHLMELLIPLWNIIRSLLFLLLLFIITRGSALWLLHHLITISRVAASTLGRGMAI
ncbi:hypothetical protein PFISCL1PPCAC_9353, partial [Pristionchus fissidentatus]